MKPKLIVKIFRVIGGIVFGILISGSSLAAPQAKSSGATAPAVDTAGAKNRVHYISKRVSQYLVQIQRDLKKKKLTQAQATTLQSQLSDVRKQEAVFLKGNPAPSGKAPKTLTDDQFSQLLRQLDVISKAIPIK